MRKPQNNPKILLVQAATLELDIGKSRHWLRNSFTAPATANQQGAIARENPRCLLSAQSLGRAHLGEYYGRFRGRNNGRPRSHIAFREPLVARNSAHRLFTFLRVYALPRDPPLRPHCTQRLSSAHDGRVGGSQLEPTDKPLDNETPAQILWPIIFLHPIYRRQDSRFSQ